MNENQMTSPENERQMSTAEMSEKQTGDSTSEMSEHQTGASSTDGEKQMSTTQLLNRQEGGTGASKDSQSEEPLVEDAGQLNERWSTLQTKFVDEPQSAVREADGLVAEVIQKLTERFAEER